MRQKKEREQKEASILTPDKLLINSRGRTSAVSFSASRLRNKFIRAGVGEYFWEREREREGEEEREKEIERQLIEIFWGIFQKQFYISIFLEFYFLNETTEN